MKTQIRTLALAAVFAFGFAACGGGGSRTEVNTSGVTLGQELSDLKAAYDKGAMSEKEYEKAKEAVMDRYDN